MTILALIIAVALPTAPYIHHEPTPRVRLVDPPKFRTTKPVTLRPIK